jgi:lactoylglutathione lyase
MRQNRQQIKSKISFLYYHDLDPIAPFYGDLLGLELVADYGWTKLYRVNGNAYLGIADERMGSHKAQETSAVLISLIVDDVPWWYERLSSSGLRMLTEIRELHEAVSSFFCEDPGGYTISIERFLDPVSAPIFHYPDKD